MQKSFEEFDEPEEPISSAPVQELYQKFQQIEIEKDIEIENMEEDQMAVDKKYSSPQGTDKKVSIVEENKSPINVISLSKSP